VKNAERNIMKNVERNIMKNGERKLLWHIFMRKYVEKEYCEECREKSGCEECRGEGIVASFYAEIYRGGIL
jgi:hypothetical protein